MHRKRRGLVILFILSALVFAHTLSRGYILPAEQLIQFMNKNFSTFRTLVITQTTEVKTDDRGEEKTAYTSKIWMKSPNLYREEILEKPEKVVEPGEYAYLPIFMAGDDHRVKGLLSSWGIRLHDVALTRIDGIVAYRIGPGDPGSPKILIEKDRFLPMLLSYLPPGRPQGEVTTVRFSDYRKVGEGWFPYEILRAVKGMPLERQVVQGLQANAAIDPSIFERTGHTLAQEKERAEGSSEADRLNHVIRSFEKKYSPQSP